MNWKSIFVAAIGVFLAGCSSAPKEQHSASPAVSDGSGSGAGLAVSATPARMGSLASGYESSGTVRARQSAQIASKVMGVIRELPVQSGDRVRQGQLLASIDPRDADILSRRAESQREELLSSIPEAQSGISAAQAQLDLALVSLRRMQVLFDKKSISPQEFDEATARAKSAEASFEMAKARRRQLDAKLAQAEIEIQSAQLMLGYATIRAPFAGRVTEKLASVGGMAVPGVPLLTIEQEGAYQLELQVEESRLLTIQSGQKVQISLDGIAQSFEAKVAEVVPTVDPASRSYVVKVPLPASPGLRAGLFGRGVFPGEPRRVMVIAATALQTRGQVEGVYVAEKGSARLRLISTGARVGANVEVLSGLSEGDLVIAPIPPNLREGDRVEVRQ